MLYTRISDRCGACGVRLWGGGVQILPSAFDDFCCDNAALCCRRDDNNRIVNEMAQQSWRGGTSVGAMEFLPPWVAVLSFGQRGYGTKSK